MSIELMLKITEHEFGNILLNSAEIQKLIKTNNFLVAREFKVGSAVPDFVLISHKDFDRITDLSQRYSPNVFRGINSSIICMLYGKSHENQLSIIARANFLDVSTLIRAAKKLEENNILKLNPDSLEIARVPEFSLPKIDVISLELKLDKWKKALWQASRNRAYYAKSFVVMPSDKETLIRQNMNYFDGNGVSAVVVDPLAGKIKFVGKTNRKDYSPELTMHRLAGISYLMQQKDMFTQLNVSSHPLS